MLFNSFSFLAFFAVVAVAYYALPHRYRWPMLLIASAFFYSTFSPGYLLLLGAVTTVSYVGGRVIAGASEPHLRRRWLGLALVLVLSALAVFKYYDFFAGSLEVLFPGGGRAADSLFPRFPRLDLVVFVGLSFYTFSCVSYLVDVYEERLPPERHFGYFAIYVSFFPKLLAGPIERARPFLEQLRAPVHFQSAGVIAGLQLMLWGLVKKVLIADHLALFVDGVYAQPDFAAPADLVLATYFFAFQLYCDFSGYSDMAIGAALVLGFHLMENFRRPYLATSVPEFWAKRWHLSLASWFRDYMYIPLGGNRVSRLRQYANLLAVFLVSGLWHGANWSFVVWGGLNGVYQIVSIATRRVRASVREFIRVPAAVATTFSMGVTFHLILLTWVFFRATSLRDAVVVFTRVGGSLGALPGLLWARIGTGDLWPLLTLVAGLWTVELLQEKAPVRERIAAFPTPVRWAVAYALIFALLIFGNWQLQSFVYMQF